MDINSYTDRINELLAEWNPIGVPSYIAKNEYDSYVPRIISAISSGDDLTKLLEMLVINEMGIINFYGGQQFFDDFERISCAILSLADNEYH